jgi:large subunit ribosomal protein L23
MATKKTTKESKDTAEKKDTSILKNARITEKAARSQAFNAYLFDVAPSATKSEIAKAFTKQYKHKPVKVHTVTQKPKSMFRKGILSFGPKGKKAYVYLPKGKTIDVM